MPKESKCLNPDGMSLIHRNSQLVSELEPLLRGQRILVSGASGWLGKNLIDLLFHVNDNKIPDSILLTGSQSRVIHLHENRKVHVSIWDESAIENFKPTLFINLAFLTRDKLLTYPLDTYINTNKELIKKARWAASLDSTKYILSTTSGVSQKMSSNKDLIDKPYETLKFLEEETLNRSALDYSKNLLTLKIWTMSGKYIKGGDLLVIQSIISSMVENKDFEIKSSNEVWRTYIDAYEMIGIALLGLLNGREGIINSGGVPVSLSKLAEAAKFVFNSQSRIIQSKSIVDSASFYASNPPDLNQIAKRHGISIMDVFDQLRETAKTIAK